MAVGIKETPAATDSGVVPYKISVKQFMKMIGAGVFDESERVELLEGVLSAKMTKHPPHDFTTERLGELLRDILEPNLIVREEKSIVLGPFWRPEADIVVALGPRDRYRQRSPAAEDLRMVIEVAESSQARDRGEKRRGYAAAKVPVYWIVDLSKRVVEVYATPSGRESSARYRDMVLYNSESEVPVVVNGREMGKIAVKEFLP